MSPRPTRLVVSAVLLALAVTGCSSGQKVGGGGIGQNKTTTGGGANLGNIGATTAPPTKHVKPVVKKTTKPAAPKPVVTKAPPVKVTTAPATQAPAPVKTQAAKAYMVGIYGDTSGKSAFDPPQQAIYVGTPIEWVNHDTVARSVTATNGAFTSPSIAPGKSYTWTPTKTGQYDYTDGTRPYANGSVQVYAR